MYFTVYVLSDKHLAVLMISISDMLFFFHPECFALSYSFQKLLVSFMFFWPLCLALLMSECASIRAWHIPCVCLGCVSVSLGVCTRVYVYSCGSVCTLPHACCLRLHLLEQLPSFPLSLRPSVALHNQSQGRAVWDRLNLEHSRGLWFSHTLTSAVYFYHPTF